MLPRAGLIGLSSCLVLFLAVVTARTARADCPPDTLSVLPGYVPGMPYTTTAPSEPDLPPGYSLTSCQGYFAGPPVATRPASWGTLKTRYR
jgi:hypothetical protein